MIESLNRITKKKNVLSFLIVLSFTIGLLQILPMMGIPNMPIGNDNSQLVNDELPIETGAIEQIGTEPVKDHQIAYVETKDYVDSHIYNGYGSTTSFSNMRSSSTNYATLEELPTSQSTLDYKYNWDPWISEVYSSTQWCEIEVESQKDFHLEDNWGVGGETSNFAGITQNAGGNSGGILSCTYNLASVDNFVFSVFLYNGNLQHSNEMRIYFKDIYGNWDLKKDWTQAEGGVDSYSWNYYKVNEDSTQYLYNGFRVKYEAFDIHLFQSSGVDAQRIVVQGPNRIDQRFRFSGVDYDEFSVEYLYIELDVQTVEHLKVEVLWDGSWQYCGELYDSGHTAFSVHDYLTSGVLDVRLTDSDTTNDGFQSEWRIEEMYLRMYDHIPTSYHSPGCDSLYDTDNIYAMKTPRSESHDSYAFLSTYHYDADVLDISYCGIAGYNGDAKLWELRYDILTNAYSLISGSAYIGFIPGTKNSDNHYIDICWRIEFKFNHPSITDMNIRAITKDTRYQMTTRWNVNWDVETRLQSALALTDTGTDTRGEINGLLLAEGAVAYYGSASLQYPPDYVVDIYIISPEVSASPWSALYDNDMFGAQYWTWVTADDQVGLDYYRSKVVLAGAGSAGTDLLVTDDSVSFIADRITVLNYSESDNRVNVNAGVYIYANLEYAYDNTAVTSGNVTINGHNATHMGDGVWRILRAETSVTAQTYDFVNVTADPYGITVVNQNSQETTIIWDGLVIAMTDPDDSRINVGDTATGITVSAIYSFDGTPYDGTLVLNSTTYTYGTVGMRGYTVASASGDTHGITLIFSNDETWCIWDGLVIAMTDPDDSRINVGDTATGISATAVYSYDGTPYDGSLVLNSTTYTYGTVGMRGYTVVSASGDTHGITLIWLNDETSCIWDGLVITMINPDDARINVGDTATGITASAIYSYDGTPYDGSLVLNSTTYTYGTVGMRGYTVVSASGDTHGITLIWLNDETSCIWDGLVITMINPDDARINVGDTATGISTTAVYSYDGSAYDGSLLQNSTTYVYGTVGKRGYTIVSASGDSYNITTILSNDETWCIWDEVEVIQLGSTPWNLANETFQVWCNLQLAYDNHVLGVGDSVLIADEAATWNGTHFILEISFTTVGDKSFYVNSTTESTHGISLIGSNAAVLVHVTDMPSIESIVSDFEAANGLYQGIYPGSPLWIHWDPVNDPVAPSFIFTVGGAYFHVWNVTSSWSGLVLVDDIATGTFVCTLETGLPYSESNYTYTIFAVNEVGYSVTQVVYITVRDYTAPVIVSEPLDIELIEGDIGFSIVWTCSDANPQSFEIRLDGVLIDNDDWLTSPENITISLDDLDAGEYVYEITIYDESGNSVQDSVIVIVNEITSTTTTSTTTTTTSTTTTTTTTTTTNTTTTGTTDPNGTLVITFVIMVGGIVIVVIIIIVRRR